MDDRTRKRLMAWLTVAALSTTLVAAPKRSPHSTKASSEEPFRSFRILDAKLTLLAHQQEALNAAFNPVQGGFSKQGGTSRRRTTASRSMNSTAAGIVLVAGGLESLYQRRHQPFGVQMFRALRIRAEEVQRGVSAVAKAQTRSAAESAAKRLDEADSFPCCSVPSCVGRIWSGPLFPGRMDMLPTKAIQRLASK